MGDVRGCPVPIFTVYEILFADFIHICYRSVLKSVKIVDRSPPFTVYRKYYLQILYICAIDPLKSVKIVDRMSTVVDRTSPYIFIYLLLILIRYFMNRQNTNQECG